MADITDTSFENIASLLNSGEITVAEMLQIPCSQLTVIERQALLFHASNISIAAAGDSIGLSAAQTPVHGSVTGSTSVTELVIPSSLAYSIFVESGSTITSGNNTLEVGTELDILARSDSQAYPAVTYSIPSGTKVIYTYTPS